jgi:CRISPR/Cas system-associated protein Cas10 (large subunit of type III CRISPR-Cas system)
MTTRDGIWCDHCKKQVHAADVAYENGVKLDLCDECRVAFHQRYQIEKFHESETGQKSKLAIYCHEYPREDPGWMPKPLSLFTTGGYHGHGESLRQESRQATGTNV